jgi:CYTH domain-containing protein/predicted ATPase
MEQRRLTQVVLTGGPCSGKTSALAYLRQGLADRGVRVITVPEAASLVITGGGLDVVAMAAADRAGFVNLQVEIGRLHGFLRAQALRLASLHGDRPLVLLYDRAEPDAAAYLDGLEYQSVLRTLGLSAAGIRDSYDAAIHLVTAADGAEAAYTLANNPARTETPELARAADRRTLAAWMGHPHLRVVDNSRDFQHKLHRVLEHVCHELGLPIPLEVERKYLLAQVPDLARLEGAGAHRVEIEQRYLAAPAGSELRVRRRLDQGVSTYYRTHKTGRGVVRQELEEGISDVEYDALAAMMLPDTRAVHKDRWCFVYRSQYFELDIFRDQLAGLVLLEIELTTEAEGVDLPPWLRVIREVTGEAGYGNAALARRGLPTA